MRELSLQDTRQISAAVKDNFELYLYAKVPPQAGEFFGGLIAGILSGTLGLEEFAKAILESPEVVKGSKITTLEMDARFSVW